MGIKIASFIKTEVGYSSKCIDSLKNIENVVKILTISGEYNLLVEINTENSEDLVFIIEKIEKIKGIKEIHSHYVLMEWEK